MNWIPLSPHPTPEVGPPKFPSLSFEAVHKLTFLASNLPTFVYGFPSYYGYHVPLFEPNDHIYSLQSPVQISLRLGHLRGLN